MVTASPSPTPSLTETVGSVFNATDWETISFKVEKQTFYAPRFKFIHAKMCPGKENPVRTTLKQSTSTSSTIIVDEAITAEDFETLLGLMYPSNYEHLSTSFDGIQLTKHNWISVLKISSLWSYQDLRSLALQHLDRFPTLSSLDKIILGRAYTYPDWVYEGLCALGSMHTLLNSSTSNLLDHSTTLRIHQIRERKEFPEAREDTDEGTFDEHYESVESDVKRAFATELETLEKSFQEFDLPRLARSLPEAVTEQPVNASASASVMTPFGASAPTWLSSASSREVLPSIPPTLSNLTRDESVVVHPSLPSLSVWRSGKSDARISVLPREAAPSHANVSIPTRSASIKAEDNTQARMQSEEKKGVRGEWGGERAPARQTEPQDVPSDASNSTWGTSMTVTSSGPWGALVPTKPPSDASATPEPSHGWGAPKPSHGWGAPKPATAPAWGSSGGWGQDSKTPVQENSLQATAGNGRFDFTETRRGPFENSRTPTPNSSSREGDPAFGNADESKLTKSQLKRLKKQQLDARRTSISPTSYPEETPMPSMLTVTY